MQEENLHDVMELLLALVFEDPHHIVVKMFKDLDGLKWEVVQSFKDNDLDSISVGYTV